MKQSIIYAIQPYAVHIKIFDDAASRLEQTVFMLPPVRALHTHAGHALHCGQNQAAKFSYQATGPCSRRFCPTVLKLFTHSNRFSSVVGNASCHVPILPRIQQTHADISGSTLANAANLTSPSKHADTSSSQHNDAPRTLPAQHRRARQPCG